MSFEASNQGIPFTGIAGDLALLTMQVETLFLHDAAGRLRCVNEPGEPPAPRFFFGQTRAGNVWRCRNGLSAELIQTLEKLAATESTSANLYALPGCVDAVRTALTTHSLIQHEWAGPAYRFPDEVVRLNDVVAVTETNAELVREGFPWLLQELEASQPCVVVVRGGTAVAVCRSVRVGPRAVEAGVETLPDFRGRGYATAVVAGWASAVRAGALLPRYSTSWDNLASQGVARRLGLVLYGVDYHWD